MATLKEKIGYGFGDMSSSMFWKIFSAYLPIFYATVFHLSLEVTGTLMLVTRIWDAVSDPMMGVIADRTSTRWGKYRPYLLWIAVPFAVAGVLLFTKPDWGETGNTVWAFATYILMMTVYTAINVPYGSMLGVMTEDSDEKTVFSSFRMFFAYAGSFIVLALWEPLCNWFAGLGAGEALTRDSQAWQSAMIVVGVVCATLFVLTFAMTRERVKTVAKTTSIEEDLGSLLHNGPWWILLGGVLFFNFFNAIRYAVIPFYFTSLIAADAQLSFFSIEFLFYLLGGGRSGEHGRCGRGYPDYIQAGQEEHLPVVARGTHRALHRLLFCADQRYWCLLDAYGTSDIGVHPYGGSFAFSMEYVC